MLFIFEGCAHKDNKNNFSNVEEDAAYLALLQCEAFYIRKERKALADLKNSLEADMLKSKDDTLNLQALQLAWDSIPHKAEDVYERTKIMADSIQNILKSHWKGAYRDTSDRRKLDKALDAAFREICPEAHQ